MKTHTKYKLVHKFKNLISTSTLVILAGISSSSAQTINPLDLVDVPLFLQGSTPPAIALSFDTSPGTKNAYMFAVEGFETNTGDVPGRKAFVAAPRVNKLYYDPAITYEYPLNVDGSEYGTVGGQTSFSKAWVDGYNHDKGWVNLNNDYKVIQKYNAESNASNAQTCYDDGFTDCRTNRHGSRAYWLQYNAPVDEEFPGSLLDNSNYSKIEVPVSQEQNFAIWFSYYKTRNMLIKSSATRAFGVLDEDFKIAWQSFKSDEAFEVPMMPLRGTHKAALWDWLLTLKAGGADKLLQATIEAGKLFSGESIYGDQPYMEDGIGELMECQQNFHVILANSRANGGGSVDLGAEDNPLVNDSNSVPFYAGGSPSYAVTYSGVGESAIYNDDVEDKSFADITYNYWARDLMPGLDDKVPRYPGNPADPYAKKNADDVDEPLLVGQDWWDNEALFWNPKRDPAKWQHMVNFVIGLGMYGRLDEKNTDTYKHLRDDTLQWDPNEGGNDKIKFADNLWHGAINSRGEYISATTPDELVAAFKALLEQLMTRRTGSSAESTVSANIVTEETKVYRTGFDATDWSGTVVAQKINLDGSIGNAIWDAACLMTGSSTLTTQPCGSLGGANVTPTKTYETRKIFTYDKASKNTYEFKYATLNSDLKAILEQSPLIQNGSATLEKMVNYIRGDSSYETRNGGVFRDRRVLLGDVIHSSAKVVRGPSESYIDDRFPTDSNIVTDGNSYTDFKVLHKERRNVILVGANDGMLHAFDANTGDELWAYIPSLAYKKLYLLANPAYIHQNYVDAAPIIRDVYTNGAWRTVAIGGLRLGGQGYYALDITEPESPKVLWEFTDDDDDDMGYSYGEPFVTRLENDKWVAFLPNGYNNIIDKEDFGTITVPDLNIGSGTSVLYMVDMESGNLLQKFDSREGSLLRTNGMASAVASDVPYDVTADTLYVGDLRGDVYRMDLRDSSNIVFEKMIKSANPYKTPITTALRLTQFNNFSTDTEDILIHIGTGKFIENIDLTMVGTDYQYVAGIFDQGTGSSEYPIDLAGDTRIVDQTATDDDVEGTRVVTKNSVSKASDLGWRLKLPNLGERVIAKMATRASAHFLIVASYLPKGGSKCSTGGASWVMVLDNRTGGQPTSGSILDNGTADGLFIENQVFGVTPIGFAGGGGEILIIGTDTGVNDGDDTSIVIPDFTWRRRSWHRMFQDGEI